MNHVNRLVLLRLNLYLKLNKEIVTAGTTGYGVAECRPGVT
jgi:hypothetical protein